MSAHQSEIIFRHQEGKSAETVTWERFFHSAIQGASIHTFIPGIHLWLKGARAQLETWSQIPAVTIMRIQTGTEHVPEMVLWYVSCWDSGWKITKHQKPPSWRNSNSHHTRLQYHTGSGADTDSICMGLQWQDLQVGLVKLVRYVGSLYCRLPC